MNADYPRTMKDILTLIECIENDMTEDTEYWCTRKDRWAILDGFSRAKMGLKAAIEEAEK